MKHFVPDFTVENDIHTVVDSPDFSKLDKLYEGRRAYYGDYHDHGLPVVQVTEKLPLRTGRII